MTAAPLSMPPVWPRPRVGASAGPLPSLSSVRWTKTGGGPGLGGGQLADCGVELFGRDDLVDQAHRQRLGGSALAQVYGQLGAEPADGGVLHTVLRRGSYDRDLRASAIRFCVRTATTNLDCPATGPTQETISGATPLTRGTNNKDQDLTTTYLQSDYSNKFTWFGRQNEVLGGFDLARPGQQILLGAGLQKIQQPGQHPREPIHYAPSTATLRLPARPAAARLANPRRCAATRCRASSRPTAIASA